MVPSAGMASAPVTAFDLVGGWTSPGLFVRLLTLGEGPWEPLRTGFTHRVTGERVRLGMGGRSATIAEAFAAGVDWFRPSIDEALLVEIADHRAVASVWDPSGDRPFSRALTLLRAANVVVDAGALAARCRTSGLAHGHDAVQALLAEAEAAAADGDAALAEPLLAAYVRFDPARARPCTLGMHALGAPDLALATAGPPDRDLPRLRAAALAVLRGRTVAATPDDRALPGPLHNGFGVAVL